MSKLKLHKCPNCDAEDTFSNLFNHIKSVHGEEALRLWELSRARDRRINFEKDIYISIITGPIGSGKSLFVTSQVLELLSRYDIDIVISNMTFRTELLSQPEEWKRLTREYIEKHYPPKWDRKERDKDGWEKTVTIRRSAVINQCNQMIDHICKYVKPNYFVHIDTETTTSALIKQIIEDKAKELGLVDADGTLLIRVLLVWDEAFSVLESRRAGTSTVIDLSEFALQSRHYGCKIWIVSPLFPTIDVRYRQICQQAFKMERVGEGVFRANKMTLLHEQIIGSPSSAIFYVSSVAPVFFFYNTWEKPIVTLTELENKVKQEEEQIQTKEKQEFSCEICGKIVLGLTNFTTHKHSHTGQIMSSIKKEESEKLLEQVKLIKKVKPDATLTEIANILNRPLTTIHDVLARIKRAERSVEGEFEELNLP